MRIEGEGDFMYHLRISFAFAFKYSGQCLLTRTNPMNILKAKLKEGLTADEFVEQCDLEREMNAQLLGTHDWKLK